MVSQREAVRAEGVVKLEEGVEVAGHPGSPVKGSRTSQLYCKYL